MTIHEKYRPHKGARSRVSEAQLNREVPVTWEYQYRTAEFPTPNILIIKERGSDQPDIILERQNIPTLKRFPEGIEDFIGRQTEYTWEPGTNEEELKWAEEENKMTRHPLVGETLAMYAGVEVKGIRQDLLSAPDERWRVGVVKNPKTHLHEFVTTNSEWAPVYVMSGKRQEVHTPADLERRKIGAHPDPKLSVDILGGVYKGIKMVVPESTLRISVDFKAEHTAQEVHEWVKKMGDAKLGAFNDAYTLPKEATGLICEMATQLRLDPEDSLPVLTFYRALTGVPRELNLPLRVARELHDVVLEDEKYLRKQSPLFSHFSLR